MEVSGQTDGGEGRVVGECMVMSVRGGAVDQPAAAVVGKSPLTELHLCLSVSADCIVGLLPAFLDGWCQLSSTWP